METQIKTLFHRALSLFLSAVLLISLGAVALPVSAAHGDTTKEELDAEYGTLVQTAIRGECHYQVAIEMMDIINAERKKEGVKALALDKAMTENAMLRAAECALYYDHMRPTGESCFTVIKEFERCAGENIAAGHKTAKDVMKDWMLSDGHRANILDGEFQSIGIGVFEMNGVKYWCQLFNGLKKQNDLTQKKKVTKTLNIEARTGLLELSISDKKLTLKDGESACLYVTNRNRYFPFYDYPLDPTGLVFTSTNTRVAEVSYAGVVSPVAGGSASILVKATNGVTLFTVPVTVESQKMVAYLTATSAGKPQVEWTRIPGASGYLVYRESEKNGVWTEKERMTDTTAQN